MPPRLRIQTDFDESIVIHPERLQPGCEKEYAPRLAVPPKAAKAVMQLEPYSVHPIEQLPYELFSHIFEVSGHRDWKDSLRISWVSRKWRNIIFTTPDAWSCLRFYNWTSPQAITHVLNLSAQRPLHITVGEFSFKQFTNAMHRIQSLSSLIQPRSTGKPVFPMLQRLAIRTGSSTLGDINSLSFPSLRHLECLSFMTLPGDAFDPPHRFPALQVLRFSLGKDPGWLHLLRSCQDTLVSLSISPSHIKPQSSKHKHAFPRLRCLQIQDFESITWPFDLTTPQLETYIEHQCSGPVFHHLDLKTVLQIRIDRSVEHLQDVPSLRILQLRTATCLNLMHGIYKNKHWCPQLALVEQESYPPLSEVALQKIERMNDDSNRTTTFTLRRLEPLPGEISEVRPIRLPRTRTDVSSILAAEVVYDVSIILYQTLGLQSDCSVLCWALGKQANDTYPRLRTDNA